MKKLTVDQFKIKFSERYENNLGLDLSKFQYISAHVKSDVICIAHNHQYLMSPSCLMGGIKGCPKCKSERISNAQKYTTDIFISKAIKTHSLLYDYSESEWQGIRNNISIICKKHGTFFQLPQNHWNGMGCPKCGIDRLRTPVEDFITNATRIHNNRYSYELVKYVNNYTEVDITCPTHGSFKRSPKDHNIYQRGCPECFPGNSSWVEIDWLNSLNVPYENRQKRLNLSGKSFLVDAIVGNVVYEFWGDFWHGNPAVFDKNDRNAKNGKLFGDLYENTMKKRKLILDSGWELVEIWESEYRAARQKIQSKRLIISCSTSN